jgi:hypothetical protein
MLFVDDYVKAGDTALITEEWARKVAQHNQGGSY